MIEVFLKGGLSVFRQGGPVQVVLSPRGAPGPRAGQEIGWFVQGGYAPNELVGRYECGAQARNFTAAASRASATAPATAQSVWPIKIAGSTVGSVTFAPGSAVGVVSITDGAMTNGEVLEVFAAPDQDATLLNVTIILGETL